MALGTNEPYFATDSRDTGRHEQCVVIAIAGHQLQALRRGGEVLATFHVRYVAPIRVDLLEHGEGLDQGEFILRHFHTGEVGRGHAHGGPAYRSIGILQQVLQLVGIVEGG